MAARLTVLLPRLVALVLIWLLALASYTLAAGSQQPAQPATTTPAAPAPEFLLVPDVRRQAYVFAKGILQDAGFAWRVDGSVKGYSANTVVSQQPAPGVRVVDNGAPTVVLSLERNAKYDERGLPENSSSYDGTAVVLKSDWLAAQKKSAPAAPATTTEPEPTTTEAEPEPAPAPAATYRKPDFAVPGARREPADELPLPDRARRLERRVAAASKPTRKLVSFWLYQHAWIVTGARFGWQGGDDALRILVRVDDDLQARFGFGAKSEAAARRALSFVESRKS